VVDLLKSVNDRAILADTHFEINMGRRRGGGGEAWGSPEFRLHRRCLPARRAACVKHGDALRADTYDGRGDYIVGDKITAADLLWGTALSWMLRFKLVPALPVLSAYVERIAARPSVTRVTAQEAERASAQTA
jgi:glutathione S-transferase